MAEITVVTTSWRLHHTNVFGVYAGANVTPLPTLQNPLHYGLKGQRPPVARSQTLCPMIDSAVVLHPSERRSHSLPPQSCLAVHCESRVVNPCLSSHGDLLTILRVVLFL